MVTVNHMVEHENFGPDLYICVLTLLDVKFVLSDEENDRFSHRSFERFL